MGSSQRGSKLALPSYSYDVSGRRTEVKSSVSSVDGKELKTAVLSSAFMIGWVNTFASLLRIGFGSTVSDVQSSDTEQKQNRGSGDKEKISIRSISVLV